MGYAFDPELAPGIPFLPILDYSDPGATRALISEFVAGLGTPDSSGVDVHDELITGPEGAPDVRVRIYRPGQRRGPAGIYHMHGGGFTVGDLEPEHADNLALARELGVLIVAVDYRLAPEHPFPAGLEDCYAGLKWMADHAQDLGIDPARIAIKGGSAGAGLGAALALLARDRGGPNICFQHLGYPALDDRLTTASSQFPDTPLWHRGNAIMSWDAYLGVGVRGTPDVSPYAAPARATDLTGLPPAYISVMHFDPLRDEGIAYALALLNAGVTVELHLFPGTFHGSNVFADAAISRRERGETIATLERALGLPA